MANVNCEACEELRQEVPQLIVNGFDDDMCTSLANDTGLSPSSGHDDCTDLNNLNDCLIGNQEEEVDLYEVCDWKTFMKQFIPNLWTTMKGVICSICGMWKAIHQLQCIVNFISQGTTFEVGEEETDGSYIVAGKGISYWQPHGGDDHVTDVNLLYIGGGLIRGSGSLKWYQNNFTDEQACWNFDSDDTSVDANGRTVVNAKKSASRKGNSHFGQTGRHSNMGELLYEIRLKKEQYPQIKNIYSGFGQQTGGGEYSINITTAGEGKYIHGQHGSCSSITGEPDQEGYSYGHLVPEGWIYIQIRLSYNLTAMPNGNQYSPIYWMGARFNADEIDC